MNRWLLLSALLMSGSLLLAQGTEEEFYAGEYGRRVALMKASAAAATGEGLDVTYYKLDLHVIPSPPTILGTVTMEATTTNSSLLKFSLDLTPLLTVNSVSINGATASVTRSGSVMEISCPVTYPIGSRLTVQISYGGLPDTTHGSIAFRTSGASPWIWTLSEPYGARDWWPCKDHPSDKADSADMWITVPAGLKVGSEGILESVISNGDGTQTHRWKHRYPISTYLISMTIGPFAEFTNWFRYSQTDSMPVLNYVLPGNLAAAQSQLPVTVEALEIFSAKFGLYPFIKEKYGHAQFGWGGGMEHQTMTSLVNFGESLVAHELAHQWYGDCITMDTWPHLWLNEGFATFCEWTFGEMKYGTANYTGRAFSRRVSAMNAAGTLYLRDTSAMGAMFDSRRVYAKGAWVLHMLRGIIGDSAFFAGMKTYVTDSRFRYKTATTEQFRSVMEAASGRDLRYFFDEWVYGERYPSYTYGWRWEPAAGGNVVVSIQQATGTTNPSCFIMPVRIVSFKGGVAATTVAWNNATEQSFTIPTAIAPDSVALDPDGWILRNVQRVASHIVERTQLPHTDLLYEPFPNPFNPVATFVVDLVAPSDFSLRLFDIRGREVAVLWDGPGPAGIRMLTWDGARFASGTYYAVMQTPAIRAVRKVVLLR